MDKIEINIGLFGTVSVGKSTFLNAISGNQYSDTEIKKTTMIPQAYVEKIDKIFENNCNNSCDKLISPEHIRKINREINESVSKEIENNLFNIDKCCTIYHTIEKLCDFLDPNIIGPNIHVSITDSPGLNDSASKNIYFEWVKQNINKFDIIIFMTDITKGLNNSDEIEVLNLLMTSMKINNNKMICLINKCDDIYFDIEQDDLVFEDNEQANIYVQANKILTDIAKNHGFDSSTNNFTPFLPISAENSFIYRTLIKNPTGDLDQIHQNKLCKNECGINQWKKMTFIDKKIFFKKLLGDLQGTYCTKILESGYLSVKNVIQNTIMENKIIFVTNHIHRNIDEIIVNDITNVDDYISKIEYHMNSLYNLQILGGDINNDIIWNNVKKSISDYINIALVLDTKIISLGSFISFYEFDKIYSLMQEYCMNLKILTESLCKFPDYPTNFMLDIEKCLQDKFVKLHDLIVSVRIIDQDHVQPTNILRYLETIRTYIPKMFDYFSLRFLQNYTNANCVFIEKYPDNFIELLKFITNNISSDKHQECICYICRIIYNKMNKYQSKNPDTYIIYLIQMKKLVKFYIGQLLRDITSIDIVYEIICQNIWSRFRIEYGTMYTQEMCPIKISGMLGKLASENQKCDLSFEKSLLNCIIELYC